jgi:hypothetical protein
MTSFKEKLEWYDITDVMLGDNYKKRSMAAALALAEKSKHPDAIWLTKIFTGIATEDVRAISDIFYAHKDDVRGLCFAEAMLLSNGIKTPHRKRLISESVERGYAFAQAYMLEHISYYGVDSEKRALWLKESLCAGERRAYFQMGVNSTGKKAREYFSMAASYGCATSMQILGHSHCSNDDDRYKLLLQSADRGNFEPLFESLDRLIKCFVSGFYGYPEVVFERGRVFMSHDIYPNALRCVDAEIFACHEPFTHIAICYYIAVCNNARAALIAWTLCLKRTSGTNLINRDVRRIILKMLWRNRIAWCPTVSYTGYKMPPGVKVSKRY